MFDHIIEDLQSNTIPDEKIPYWVVKALRDKKAHLDESCAFQTTYIAQFGKYLQSLLESHTSPVILSIVSFVFPKKDLKKMSSLKEVKQAIGTRLDTLEKHVDSMYTKIGHIGAEKLKTRSTVFCFGYSYEVSKILDYAKRKKPTLSVVAGGVLEKGKLLAKEAASLQIPVHYYSDVSLRQAIKRSNYVFLEVFAFAKGKFYCPMGAEMAAIIAKDEHIPVYLCAHVFKNASSYTFKETFDDIWVDSPKKVTVHDLSFEKVDPSLITGVLCEEGILKPKEYAQTTLR
ncbi:MAG: hypothetical protein ACMXYK_03110 [Candidatus Woesearchaeota archaeon]